MKFLITLLFTALTMTSMAQSYRLMTYNLRYDTHRDGDNQWNNRRDKVARLVDHYEPHVLGIQEGLLRQLDYLDSALVNYRFVGVGRDDGKTKGEYSAIFYDTTVFDVLESATFWLSDTPERVSVGWDASMERICTWAHFRNRKDGSDLWVFNTHFDHIGKAAQYNSAMLLTDVIRQKTGNSGAPVVLMGDLNVTPDEKAIEQLNHYLSDSREVSIKTPYGPEGTFSGFDPMVILDRRIDYIFVKNAIVRSQVHVDDRRDNNLYPSDHLPVMAILAGTK